MTTKSITAIFTYNDGRLTRELNGIEVCLQTGILYSQSTARGPVKAGLNVLVNGVECKVQGLDPLQVMANQSPKSCLMQIGENPGCVVTEKVKLTAKQSNAQIASNIEAEHGKATASAWLHYKSSERADRAEDTFATQILRSAGY